MSASEVYYHEDGISVYWGEWTYWFEMDPVGNWTLKISAWSYAAKPFFSDPLGK